MVLQHLQTDTGDWSTNAWNVFGNHASIPSEWLTVQKVLKLNASENNCVSKAEVGIPEEIYLGLVSDPAVLSEDNPSLVKGHMLLEINIVA